MKLCAISDLHGQLEVTIDPCDILCICGDIVPLNYQVDINKSDKWFKQVFIPWCQELPVEQIYLVGGNHDFFLQNRDHLINEYLIGTKIIYLNNASAEYLDENTGKVYTLWGSPDCHIFGNWAFMYSPETELEHFARMPKNVDIVLTHDAPYGVSDICMEEAWWNKGEHIGNPELTQIVVEQSPKLLLHGHLHSTNHDVEMLNDTKVYNVSILNEQYKIAYNPLYLDYETI